MDWQDKLRTCRVIGKVTITLPNQDVPMNWKGTNITIPIKEKGTEKKDIKLYSNIL